MKKIYPFLFAVLLCSANYVSAQITISGSTGTANGTYTSFTNASGAFAALNTAGSHNAGDVITISITGDVNTEAGTNALNAGTWASITVTPAGARTISGTSTAGAPLIDFNGADNVTVNGLNSGGNSLTISNISTSATSGTSTIRFQSDATNNLITNCAVLGSATMAAGTNGGNIWFGSNSSAGGNDNNTISYCDIGPAGGNLPTKGIYFSGSASPNNNDNITIRNNNIFDYFGAAVASTGIYIGGTTSAVAITDNKFYQTAPRVQTTGSQHSAIWITNTSGVSFNVSNNTVGYANNAASGLYTLTGITASTFFPIYLNVGTGTATSVQNNTITAINFTRTGTVINTNDGIFSAIDIQAGQVNVGTVTGNTIGAATGANSIAISTGSSSGNLTVGIFGTSASSLSIQNNTIGALTVTSATAASGQAFMAIQMAGSGSHTVSNNTIGNSTVNNIAIGTAGVTTGATSVNVIFSTSTGATTNITGNTVQNVSVYGLATTNSFFYGIRNSGACGTLNITGNTLSTNRYAGLTTSSTSFAYLSILNGAAVTTAINLNNNIITGCNIISTSLTGIVAGIVNSSGAAGSSISINNNSFSSFSFTNTLTAGVRMIDQSASVTAENINSNTFNNISLSSSGTYYLIRMSNTTQTVNATGNTIVGSYARTVTSTNSMYGIFNGSSPVNGVHNISNNTLTGIAATNTNTSGSVIAIYYEAGSTESTSPATTISNNTVSINNTGTGNVLGIWGDYSKNLRIFNNTITSLSTAGNVYGIYAQFLGPTANIYKNKICDLSTSGSSGFVIGTYLGDFLSSITTACNLYNNYIGNLSAAASSGNSQLIGIYLDGSASANSFNVYYNTVNISGTSSGANFGTAALFSWTEPQVNIIDNILVNISTPNGTGKTTAYQRGATTITTYSTTSNNNLFYAGTPGVNNLLYYDGTNSMQTLATMQAFVTPRESASLSSMPFFTSTTCGNVGFLHLDTDANCAIDGMGASIPGYTDDYDGDTRNASTPDIGADEFTGNFNLTVTTPIINCGSVDLTAASVTAGSTSGTTLSYWEDAAATIPIQAIHGTASAITTNGTYYIKSVKGSCSDIKAVAVTVTTAATSTALALATTSGCVPVSCDEAGWTYYRSPSDASKYLFAINWDPTSLGVNASAKASATVDLTVDPAGVFTQNNPAVPMGTWTMGRYWNVNLNGGTMTNPVNVRFFYDAAEKTATDNAATNFITLYPTGTLEPATWFKTKTGSFAADAAHMNADQVYNAIGLVDQNAGPATTINSVLYAQFDGVSSFSGGTYATGVGPNTPLPITLNYLNGVKQGSSNLLTWKVTCNTTPTATLTLERSSDARNFNAVYSITADALRCQSAFDHQDVQPLAGINYYRLKMTDAFGKVTYSNIISILNEVKGFEIVGIAPNPVVNGRFKLNVTSAEAAKMNVVITDMQGRVVQQRAITLIGGYNQVDMHVEHLAAGTYSISGSTAQSKSKVIRFVKQ